LRKFKAATLGISERVKQTAPQNGTTCAPGSLTYKVPDLMGCAVGCGVGCCAGLSGTLPCLSASWQAHRKTPFKTQSSPFPHPYIILAHPPQPAPSVCPEFFPAIHSLVAQPRKHTFVSTPRKRGPREQDRGQIAAPTEREFPPRPATRFFFFFFSFFRSRPFNCTSRGRFQASNQSQAYFVVGAAQHLLYLIGEQSFHRFGSCASATRPPR
jgi:hypothetical protein